jgi:molybdate transport system ATP-binding protein
MEAPLELSGADAGLFLVTGPNGSGKTVAARALAERTPGAELLSAESQQAFYEAQLSADNSDFQEATDYGSTLHELLGEAGRAHPLFQAFRLEPLWEHGYRTLSTGESRKVLLLAAVLRAPTLLVLDDPFDGLDVAAVAELAPAIVQVAEHVRVLVVGTFGAQQLPFPLVHVREVVVLEQHAVVFRGSPQAWRARHEQHGHARRPPPVELGSFYEALDPSVPLVELRKGRVQWGELVVFEELDFTVHAGQHTLIEGPNGSGKSTLLELISGDHPQAYSNDLHLFGRRRGSGETVWDIKKNVGLVSSKLHRDYRVGGSVEEVLISGLFDSIGVYQPPEPSHRARARAWLEWLDLGIAPGAAFRELSFGQQRFVLIARAAIKVPPLVVMDEPNSGLDPDNRERALELIASLCGQQKSTVLMVTHRDDERAFWERRIQGARLRLGAKP